MNMIIKSIAMLDLLRSAKSFNSYILVLLSAFLLCLSMPGYSISPVAFIALTPLFYAIKSDYSKLYLKIYIFSIIFYCISLRWLLTTISYYGGAPVYISVIILLLFSSYLSIYWLIFIYFFKKIDNPLVLAVIFVSLEIIRGSFLSGFPWLNLAQSQYNNIYILKISSLIGEYGLSFIIILTNLLLFKYFYNKQLKYLFISVLIVIISIFIGFILIKINPIINSNLKVTVVQPSYEQKLKWDIYSQNRIINYVKSLLDKAYREHSNLVVLPEAVFPTFFNANEGLEAYIKSLSYNKPLVFGNIRAEERKGKYKYFNSVYYVNKGEISIYDKIHLVPFGEFFPLKDIFKPIKYYFFGDSDAFTKGKEYKIFNIDNKNFASLICYEGAFTNLVQKFIEKNPTFLIINTNDSWFGDSIGRIQHLAIAKIRAAETSKYIIRAAQSGVSACIDPNGKIESFMSINEEGYFNCEIKKARYNSVFNYFQYTWLLLIIIIIAIKYTKDYIDYKQ